MGTDYVYANHTKRQYLDVGLFGEGCSVRHAGYCYGSRVLSLLISEHGNWQCDSIEMVSDVCDKWKTISADYASIDTEAELLILNVDGVGVFDGERELDLSAFTKLCLYARILRRSDVIRFLDRRYGPGGWQKQFEDRYRGMSSSMETAIIEALERKLVLYPI